MILIANTIAGRRVRRCRSFVIVRIRCGRSDADSDNDTIWETDSNNTDSDNENNNTEHNNMNTSNKNEIRVAEVNSNQYKEMAERARKAVLEIRKESRRRIIELVDMASNDSIRFRDFTKSYKEGRYFTKTYMRIAEYISSHIDKDCTQQHAEFQYKAWLEVQKNKYLIRLEGRDKEAWYDNG